VDIGSVLRSMQYRITRATRRGLFKAAVRSVRSDEVVHQTSRWRRSSKLLTPALKADGALSQSVEWARFQSSVLKVTLSM
jgi:hypothetical protein